jgi:hypothetical protein
LLLTALDDEPMRTRLSIRAVLCEYIGGDEREQDSRDDARMNDHSALRPQLIEIHYISLSVQVRRPGREANQDQRATVPDHTDARCGIDCARDMDGLG